MADQPQPPQNDPLLILQAELAHLRQQLQNQGNLLQQHQVQIAAPAPPRIKPDRPSPFSGKKSESLEAWIFQMQQFCELAPVPEGDRIPFAATFFKDQAALWWRSYHQTIDWTVAVPTWAAFLTALRLQFVPVNTTISAYDRLQRLSQKASVNAYNHEFRTVMLELPDMDQATRMNYYLRGLKDNIRPFVAMQQPANLAAAETIAERVDAVTFKPTARGSGFRPNPNYRSPGGAVPMELDAITKLTPGERDRLRREGGCFRCRKKGHLARDCTLTNRTHPGIHAIEEQPEDSGKE
jgi:Ty3 transposon capsid-like protein/Zinc knuckle